MGPRTRKAVGSVGVIAFLTVYVWAAIGVGERLPQHWAAQLAFYGLAGVLWGVPLFPLISWMHRKG